MTPTFIDSPFHSRDREDVKLLTEIVLLPPGSKAVSSAPASLAAPRDMPGTLTTGIEACEVPA
jgi:hypothetical protein